MLPLIRDSGKREGVSSDYREEVLGLQSESFSLTRFSRAASDGHKGRVEGWGEHNHGTAPPVNGNASTDRFVPRVSKRLEHAGKTPVLYRAMSRKAIQCEGGDRSGGRLHH